MVKTNPFNSAFFPFKRAEINYFVKINRNIYIPLTYDIPLFEWP